MNWLHKLFSEIVSMIFMMVGITPPEKTRKKNDETRDP
jgi:hypothetical protein